MTYVEYNTFVAVAKPVRLDVIQIRESSECHAKKLQFDPKDSEESLRILSKNVTRGHMSPLSLKYQ